MTIRIRLGGDDHDKLFPKVPKTKEPGEASARQKVTRSEIAMTKLYRLSHFFGALWHGKLEWVNNKSQLELLQRTFRTLGEDLKGIQTKFEKKPLTEASNVVRDYTKAIGDARAVIEVLKRAKADKQKIAEIEKTVDSLDEAVRGLRASLQGKQIKMKPPSGHKDWAQVTARPRGPVPTPKPGPAPSQAAVVRARTPAAPAAAARAKTPVASRSKTPAAPTKAPSSKAAAEPEASAKPLKTPDGSPHHVVSLPREMSSPLARMDTPPRISEDFAKFLLRGGNTGQDVSLSHPLFQTFIQENYGEDVLQQGRGNFGDATFNLRVAQGRIQVLLPEERGKRKGFQIPVAKAPLMLEDKGAAVAPKPKEKSEEQRGTGGFSGRRAAIAFGMALLGASALAATGTAFGPSLFAANAPHVETQPFVEAPSEAAHGTLADRNITSYRPSTFAPVAQPPSRFAQPPSRSQASFPTMPPQIAPPPPRTTSPSIRQPLGDTPEMQPEEPSWGPVATAVAVGGAAALLGTAVGVACLFGRPKAGASGGQSLSASRAVKARELTGDMITNMSRAVRFTEIDAAQRRELPPTSHRNAVTKASYEAARTRHYERKAALEKDIVGEGQDFDLNRLTDAQFSQWERGMLASLDSLRSDVDKASGKGNIRRLTVEQRYDATIGTLDSALEWRVELQNLQQVAGMEGFCGNALTELDKAIKHFPQGKRALHELTNDEIKAWKRGLESCIENQRDASRPLAEEVMRSHAPTGAAAGTLKPPEGGALVRSENGSTAEFRPVPAFTNFASELRPGELKIVSFKNPEFAQMVNENFLKGVSQEGRKEFFQIVGDKEFKFSRMRDDTNVVLLEMPDMGSGPLTFEITLSQKDMLASRRLKGPGETKSSAPQPSPKKVEGGEEDDMPALVGGLVGGNVPSADASGATQTSTTTPERTASLITKVFASVASRLPPFAWTWGSKSPEPARLAAESVREPSPKSPTPVVSTEDLAKRKTPRYQEQRPPPLDLSEEGSSRASSLKPLHSPLSRDEEPGSEHETPEAMRSPAERPLVSKKVEAHVKSAANRVHEQITHFNRIKNPQAKAEMLGRLNEINRKYGVAELAAPISKEALKRDASQVFGSDEDSSSKWKDEVNNMVKDVGEKYTPEK